MSQFDDDLMFSDGQQVAAAGATTSQQSVNLAPLEFATGRNIGVGTSLYIEVYGYWTTAVPAPGNVLIEVLTDGDELMGSPNTILNDAGLTAPTVLGVASRIWLVQVPLVPNLEQYLGLRYTFAAAAAGSVMNLTAGITLMPTQLRNYGNGLKIS